MKNLNEAIMKRVSIRSYIDKPLAKVKKSKILKILNHHRTGPFGNKTRFELIDTKELTNTETKNLPSHNEIINGANMYVVGAVKKKRHSLEDFGYCMEKIILKATKLGFGTCWMAGPFTRTKLAGGINIRKDEFIPCLSPIGYFQQKKALSLQIMELMAGTRQRKSWEELFFIGDMESPLEQSQAGPYTIPLEAVRVAPSDSNKQPWRVIKEKEANIFHFFLKSGDDGMADSREPDVQYIDMGIAMCHFETSARELDLNGSWIKTGKTIPGMEYTATWQEE